MRYIPFAFMRNQRGDRPTSCYYFNNNIVENVIVDSSGRNIYVGDFTSYYTVPCNYAIALSNDFEILSGFNTPITIDRPIVDIVETNDTKFYVNVWDNFNVPYIKRLNFDGSIDTSFVTYNATRDQLTNLVVDSSNRLWFGEYTNPPFGGGAPTTSLIKCLNTTGGTVYTLSINGGANSIATQTTGKIIVGSRKNSVSDLTLQRFNTNGTIDSTFAANVSGITNDIREVIVDESNDKIYISSSTSGALGGSGLLRLNSDGTTDGTFSFTAPSPYSGVNGPISLRPDGKLYVCLGGHGVFALNTNGSVDTSFAEGLWDRGVTIDLPNNFSCLSNNNLIITGYNGYTGAQSYTVSGTTYSRRYVIDVNPTGFPEGCPYPPF